MSKKSRQFSNSDHYTEDKQHELEHIVFKYPNLVLDSQMYQSVGCSAVEYIAQALELPLFTETIRGCGKSTDKDYVPIEVTM